MVRLVLFDVDGTLIRTGGVGVQAFAKTLAAEFNVTNGTERIRFGGRTDTSLVREIFRYGTIDPSPQNFRRFFDHYVFWLDHLLHANRVGGVCPGVRDLLAGLRALPASPILGLLTGNIRLGAEIKLRRYDLWHEFQTGAFGDDDEDRNRIALMAKARGSQLLGRPLRGGEILVVGDTPHDIRCGRAIDARVLAVATGGASLDELEQHQPDWTVADLSQCQPAVLCG